MTPATFHEQSSGDNLPTFFQLPPLDGGSLVGGNVLADSASTKTVGPLPATGLHSAPVDLLELAKERSVSKQNTFAPPRRLCPSFSTQTWAGIVMMSAAVFVLHGAVQRGEARLLGTMGCVSTRSIAPCLDVINTWFGHTEIPVGTLKDV